ncbi:MAG TPA: hypothetical protein V6C90_23575 [Coleofasciculaceae cyanobacterium]
MKKLQGITGLGLVTLLLVSCTSNSNVSKAPTPKPSVEPVSVAPNPPMPSPSVPVVPKELIVATNPTTFPISKGRIDPFGAVTVAPIKQSVSAKTNQKPKNQDSQPQKPKNQDSQSQKLKNQDSQSQKPKNQDSQPQKLKNQDSQPQKPKNQDSQPQKPKNQDSQPQIGETGTASSSGGQTTLQNLPVPPVPSTDLAKAVEVNGVMQVEGKVSAIVKEPNEQISRSVSEGDYLSKGAVLVKRIEFSNNEEPLVILEQNGVEVIKSVSSNNGSVASIQ